MVSYPENSKPEIQWNHIDGPLLHCRDGTLHWLGRVEVIWLYLGFTNINQLDNKYCMEPQRG